MRPIHTLINIFIMLLSLPIFADNSIYALNKQTFIQCSNVTTSSNLPDFSQPNCISVKFRDIDAQGRELWLQTELPNAAIKALKQKPIGLYLMGKAASILYLNGEKIGENGLPGNNAKNEIVGKMDHVFYLPKQALKAQNNQLVLHISGHNSYIELAYPMHFIGLATYGESKRFIQSHSTLGLVFLGMFILSAIYFGSLVLRIDNKLSPSLLFLMSTFAGAQLAVEMSRGLFNYSYPIHDLRLVCICLLALGFSLSLLTLLCHKFAGPHKLHWIYSGALLTSITVLIIPGFDIKTNLALVLPVAVSSILIMVNLKKQFNWVALKYLAVLVVFICTVSVTFQYFHELVFYIIVAILLAYLFAQQANDYSIELETAQNEKALRAKLEFKLEQVQQQKPETINIHSGGKIEKIAAQEIFYCQASGDYVEIYLKSRELLYGGSLKSISPLLPATFIRVHRSYVVNLDKVISLKRDTENGYLILSNDAQIPVSRRMMPQVKETFSSH